MAELLRPTIDNTRSFLATIGLALDRYDLILPFPGVFSDRRVVKVMDRKKRELRVLKARPKDSAAEREASSMGKIMSTYRFSHSHFNLPEKYNLRQYLVFNMPFLGYDLGGLAQDLSLLSIGYESENDFGFSGFNFEKIDQLCEMLRIEHMNFARQYGLVHGDLWQKTPNNIVYHPNVDRLLLVDAEGLGLYDEERAIRFHEQVDRVQEWMHESLLKV